MALPTTSLPKYFRNGKVAVLLGGRIYDVRKDRINGNVLSWYGGPFGLHDNMKLSDLETDYFEESEKEINNHVGKLVKEETGKLNKELENQRDLLHLVDNYEFVRLIVEKIAPVFNPALARANGKEHTLSCSTQSTKPSDDFASVRRKYDFGIINDVLKGTYLICDGKFFPLVRTASLPMNRNRFLTFGGCTYDIADYQFSVNDIESKYQSRINAKIRQIAVENSHSLASKMDDISKEKNLLAILQKDEHYWPLKVDSGRRIGFVNGDKGFYICYPIDDTFILYDPKVDCPQKYFGYGPGFGIPPLLIGVMINRNGNGVSLHHPVIINKAAHPSINCFDRLGASTSHAGNTYSPICAGYYDFNKSVKEAALERNVIHFITQSNFLIKNYACSDSEWAPFFRCYGAYQAHDGVYVKLMNKSRAEGSKFPIANLEMLAEMEHIKR